MAMNNIIVKYRLYFFRVFYVLISVVISGNAFSQGEANNWYFGYNAGLSFNTDPPLSMSDGKIKTNEGTAIISDGSGQLLFYTDGVTVWDRNHTITPNGMGLNGSFTSTQSAIIVPRPGSNAQFYIFTVDFEGGINGVQFSLFDLSLNSGNGDVADGQKNIKLVSPTCEKITAVQHFNKRDFWVLTAKYNSDTIYSYLVTDLGVNTLAVKSKTGLKINSKRGSQGQMKLSPDGTKLAYANNIVDTCIIADFNSRTGSLTNIWKIPHKNSFGLEFSSNSNYLYITDHYNYFIHQFNTKVNTISAFIASRFTVDSINKGIVGSLQIGPDKKIYICRQAKTYLDVISVPDSAGKNCKIIRNYINLKDKMILFGLPNFIQSYFLPPVFKSSKQCINSPTYFSIMDTSKLDSVKWDFGDTTSKYNSTMKMNGVSHVYSNFGNYKVRLIIYYFTGSDTFTSIISIKKTIVDFTVADVCENDSARFINLSVEQSKLSFKLKFGDGQNSVLVSPTHFYQIDGVSKTFNVTLVGKNSDMCSDSISKAVSINSNPKSDFSYTVNQNSVDFKATQSGNTSYKWYFGNGDSSSTKDISYTYPKLGKYTVCLYVTNAAGCFSKACKEISVTVGVSGIAKQTGFKVYPNPNTGRFTIEIENPANYVSIEVYDVLGNLIKRVETSPNNVTYSTDLILAKGIYMVKLKNGEMGYYQKIAVDN